MGGVQLKQLSLRCLLDLQRCLIGSRAYDGEGNGNPLQYSCLENAMDRGAWWAIVHGVARVRHDLATKPSPPPGHMNLELGEKSHLEI